jgi:hypothetical protein
MKSCNDPSYDDEIQEKDGNDYPHNLNCMLRKRQISRLSSDIDREIELNQATTENTKIMNEVKSEDIHVPRLAIKLLMKLGEI